MKALLQHPGLCSCRWVVRGCWAVTLRCGVVCGSTMDGRPCTVDRANIASCWTEDSPAAMQLLQIAFNPATTPAVALLQASQLRGTTGCSSRRVRPFVLLLWAAGAFGKAPWLLSRPAAVQPCMQRFAEWATLKATAVHSCGCLKEHIILCPLSVVAKELTASVHTPAVRARLATAQQRPPAVTPGRHGTGEATAVVHALRLKRSGALQELRRPAFYLRPGFPTAF